MKQYLRFFALTVLLCMLLCLAACGEDTPTLPEGVSYAIQVVDGDRNPVAGAMVSLCQNVDGGICYLPAKTGEDGVAYFYENVVPAQDNMKVRVLMAEGYDLPLDDTGDIRYTLIPDGTAQMTLTLSRIAE